MNAMKQALLAAGLPIQQAKPSELYWCLWSDKERRRCARCDQHLVTPVAMEGRALCLGCFETERQGEAA